MAVVTHHIRLDTRGRGQVTDLTPQLRDALAQSGLKAGVCVVHCPGSTGAVTAMEFEPGVVADLTAALERLAPAEIPYAHNTHDDNGVAHIRAALLGPSVSVPVVDGALALGAWQQIVFLDFDTRPRQREIVIQFVGE